LKLLVIFNPHAAAGRAKALLPDVESAWNEIGRVDVLLTSGAGDATRMVEQADLSSYDGIVAAGGDGTLFEVVNGLYAHDADCRVPLGLLPVGTGNAFARDLGLLPGDWKKGLEIIAAGGVRKVDAGRVETPGESFHFLNIIGVGLPVDAMRSAERIKFVGNSAYTLATLWQAMRLKTYPFRISLDGVEVQQESLFVEVSNTRYTGTSFLIAPTARLDDGLFDVTLVGKLSRPRLLRLFPTIYSGRHVDFDEVDVRRAREIRLESPEGLTLAPDGEFCGATPAKITCLERDLEIFA
jgi:diacylglycerol kinase (ATP)